jgi:hypothetical protein
MSTEVVCRRGHHDHPHTHEEVSTARKNRFSLSYSPDRESTALEGSSLG